MSTETKKSGMMAQITVGVVIALCVGGSSPWWIREVKDLIVGTSPEQTQVTEPQAARSRPATVSDSSYLAGLDKSDVSEQQKLLEMELEELRAKQREAPQSRASRGQANISGTWHDDDSECTFYQDGNKITLEEITPGYGRTAIGEGTIDGNEILVNVQTLYGDGTLRATLSSDGRRISGTFTSHILDMSTPYTITR